MKDSTLLLRQAHPNFMKDGELTSQVFLPFPKDKGSLSVYDGDMIDAKAAYEHYTKKLQNSSHSVWCIECSEVSQTGLAYASDPLEDFPCHALIQFGDTPQKECRKLAKRLKDFAQRRGCMYKGGKE